MKPLRIGTRASELALWQAHYLQDLLNQHSIASELVLVQTKGDTDHRPFRQIAGDGFFTKALEEKLADHSIDVAIHSCKDLASQKLADLPWRALGPRADTQDVLILKKEHADNQELQNLRIGTSSPRRMAQLQLDYPLAKAVELRGNVPTRLQKALSDEYDGIILAKAGLLRLGLLESLPDSLIYRELDWVTAPCQGILAVQGSNLILDKLKDLFDPTLQRIAEMEKSILAFLGGGCHMAVGAQISAELDRGFRLRYFFHEQQQYHQVDTLFAGLDELQSQLFARIEAMSPSAEQLVLTHSLAHHRKVYQLAKAKGLSCVSLPTIEIQSCMHQFKLEAEFTRIAAADALVFSSQYAVKIFMLEYLHKNLPLDVLHNKQFLCVGQKTLEKFADYGLPVEAEVFPNAAALVQALANEGVNFHKLLFIGSPDSELLKQQIPAKIQLDTLFVYKSVAIDNLSFPLNKNLIFGFASPLSVANFLSRYGNEVLKTNKVVAIGPTTAGALDKWGIAYQQNILSGSWEKLIETVLNYKG